MLGASAPLLRGGATRTFVVECYRPEISEKRVRRALSRVDPLSVSDDSRSGGSVCCILIPSEGMALFLFRGASEDLVRDRGENAEIPFDRIVESIHIGFIEQQL